MSDRVFCANQSLAHRCRRNKERRGDHRCIEPEHRLQHQWSTNADVNRRVRASKQQREPLIGNFRIGRSSIQPFRHNAQLLAGNLISAPSSRDINKLPSCDSQKPSFRIRRTAIPRPIRQRRSECLRKRILGRSHIPGPRRKKGDELAVAPARHSVRRATRQPVAFEGVHVIVYRHLLFAAAHAPVATPQRGRTSTIP